MGICGSSKEDQPGKQERSARLPSATTEPALVSAQPPHNPPASLWPMPASVTTKSDSSSKTVVTAGGLDALLLLAVEQKLTDNESCGRMRANVASGRFTTQHYVDLWTKRLGGTSKVASVDLEKPECESIVHGRPVPTGSHAEQKTLRAAWSVSEAHRALGVWHIRVLREFLLGCQDPKSPLIRLCDAHRMREYICELAVDGFLGSVRYELLEAVKYASVLGIDGRNLRGAYGGLVQMKAVIVGESCVGKTMLKTALSDPSLISNGNPSSHTGPIEVEVEDFGNSDWSLEVWDTAGQQALQILRLLSYPGTDVFVVCYDMSRAESLRNVVFFVKEIHEHMEEQTCEKPYSIILCGCKYDLWIRDQQNTQKVDLEEVAQVAKDIDAVFSLHTSAKTGHGISKDAIEEAWETSEYVEEAHLNGAHGSTPEGFELKEHIVFTTLMNWKNTPLSF